VLRYLGANALSRQSVEVGILFDVLGRDDDFVTSHRSGNCRTYRISQKPTEIYNASSLLGPPGLGRGWLLPSTTPRHFIGSNPTATGLNRPLDSLTDSFDVSVETKVEAARFPSSRHVVEAALRGWLPLFDIFPSEAEIGSCHYSSKELMGKERRFSHRPHSWNSRLLTLWGRLTLWDRWKQVQSLSRLHHSGALSGR
jgi:hypothetical protein